MDKTTRKIAVRLAVALFFVMALVGWISGHEPAEIARRAAIGAVALYLVAQIAGNLAMRVLLEAMARDQARRQQQGEYPHNENM
jgi:hypothetical protein